MIPNFLIPPGWRGEAEWNDACASRVGDVKKIIDCSNEDDRPDDDEYVHIAKRRAERMKGSQQTYPPNNVWLGRSDVQKWSSANEEVHDEASARVRASEECAALCSVLVAIINLS
jgi:hypothetical protein